MRMVPSTPRRPGDVLPVWPPVLATSGMGGRSATHSHHAMHVVLTRTGQLTVDVEGKPRVAPGVLTRADVPHAIDATGVQVLLVFIDPESDEGARLSAIAGAPVRLLTVDEVARVGTDWDAVTIVRKGGADFLAALTTALGGEAAVRRRIHPRVRRVLRHLRELPASSDISLDALATVANLSPGRLMHAFTESIGVPLRPYLAWLKLQRAAGAVASGVPLAQAATQAGFVDAGHMTRSFRRMLGVTPSALRSASGG
jgi:AraC-like DNA-binding protein